MLICESFELLDTSSNNVIYLCQEIFIALFRFNVITIYSSLGRISSFWTVYPTVLPNRQNILPAKLIVQIYK